MTARGARTPWDRAALWLGPPPYGVSLALTVGLIVVIFTTMVATLGSHAGGLGGSLPLVVTFLVAVVVAEQLRMHLPGRMDTAPLVTAVGMAMALATDLPQGPITYSAGGCILAVGLAIAVGVLPRHVRLPRDATADALDTVVRLFSVTVAAVVWRSTWPGLGPEPLMVLSREWDRWQTACAMLAVGLAVMLLEAPLRAARRSVQEDMGWRQATRDEAMMSMGLGSAVAVTATMTASCLPVLGLLAVPLMMLPMVFTQHAVRRQSLIRETYRQTVTALSRMPEVVGVIPRGHAEAVRQLSVAVGRRLGMRERDVNDLEFAALLHDIGQLRLRDPIPGGATVQAATVDQERIADNGAAIVRETGVLGSVAEIIETQATPYRRVVERLEKLPMSGRILKVTNAYVDFYTANAQGGASPAACRDAALERIYLGLGYQFDPLVVGALERTLGQQNRAGVPSTFAGS